MALVMVQGHLCEVLLSPEARAHGLYQLQLLFHGSTAPGFLFASGFVAGLPRAPLSLKASLRRSRRLCFVLGVGYALHLPYFSLWKTILQATPAERAALFACDALQVIAATQLFVLILQWLAGAHWIRVAGLLAVVMIAAGPFVWAFGVSAHLPPALGAYLDRSTGSSFPLFPFAATVLAGTVAGAAIGRRDPATRHRRAISWGAGLVAAGAVLAIALSGVVDFWGVSPAYVLLRIGGLLLLLRAVEVAAERGLPGIPALALLGHETLLVYVFHLYLLYGGIVGAAPLAAWVSHLGFLAAGATLLGMVPVLLAAAWAWHAVKQRFPREAHLLLAFLTTAFLYEFATRPW